MNFISKAKHDPIKMTLTILIIRQWFWKKKQFWGVLELISGESQITFNWSNSVQNMFGWRTRIQWQLYNSGQRICNRYNAVLTCAKTKYSNLKIYTNEAESLFVISVRYIMHHIHHIRCSHHHQNISRDVRCRIFYVAFSELM